MNSRLRVHPRQDGVALAILVWFLAAISLLVAGIVLQARVDVKLAQLHATQARVGAAADGAIQLALIDLLHRELEGEFAGRAAHTQAFTVGKFDVAVSFTPLAGLIDLNKAPEELLFALFSTIEDLDENVAEEIALNVVEWRTATSGLQGTAAGEDAGSNSDVADEAGEAGPYNDSFEAIEDLLLVPGIDRTIFEAVRDAVYVSDAGQPGVDWISAPVSVLRALGDVDEEFAIEVVKSRIDAPVDELLAPLELDMDFQQSAALSSFRVDALVKFDDTLFLRRRWVDRASAGADGLPWRFFRTEAVTVVPQAEQDTLARLEAAYAGE